MRLHTLMGTALLVVVLFFGCAAQVRKDARPANESLKDSVNQYWTYIMKGDKAGAVLYENLYYKTEGKIKDEYVKASTKTGTPVLIKEFKITGIEAEGSGPEGFTPVKIELAYTYPNAPFPVPEVLKNKITDYWIQREGTWYHIRHNMAGFF